MTELFLVMSPGPFTTVQDKGRFGHQHLGIPVSGALDGFAFRTANLLVGNPRESAVLEMTVVGAKLAVMREADVALTGAPMEMKLNAKPIESWQSLRVLSGDMLSIQTVKSGCRGYLAVTGGIAVPEVMGSCSTYAGGKLGGHRGRPLRKGDIIQSGPGNLLHVQRHLPLSMIPQYARDISLRALPGPQHDRFEKGLTTLFKSEYLVSAQADRMGLRLKGPPIAQNKGLQKSIISEPTIAGSIQIPADSQPIILLSEQTVGGYAKIATVISADLPKIAQAKPGDSLHFDPIRLEDAHAIYRQEEEKLQQISDILSKQYVRPFHSRNGQRLTAKSDS